MITTVCLNPAVDQSAAVERLRPGEVNRLLDKRMAIGGKGINVAIVLGKLGIDVRCVGFIGEADMPLFAQSMKRHGVRLQAVDIPGNVRRNLKIMDSADGAVTELNEQGAAVDDTALKQLMRVVREQDNTGQWIALSGSLPPGCPQEIYGQIMRQTDAVRCAVDTSGEALRFALREKPFLIKPNLVELQELIGETLGSLAEIRGAAVKLHRMGARHVAVSLGDRGAILTDGANTLFSPALDVPMRSTVGAGDAMLAGLLLGFSEGETLAQSLRYGTAAAAACVQGGGVEAVTRPDFEVLLTRTTVENL